MILQMIIIKAGVLAYLRMGISVFTNAYHTRQCWFDAYSGNDVIINNNHVTEQYLSGELAYYM